MDTISILYESSGLTVALRLDAVEQETYSGDVEITQHPVERGAPVSDHMRAQPRPFEVRGTISSASLVDDEGASLDRLQRALDVLEELRNSSDLVTVVTPLQVRERMHLKGYRATHSTGMPGALDVSLTFAEVRIVEAQRVKVKLPKKGPDRTKGGATAGAKDGKQVASAASDEAQRKSLAARGVDALLGR